MDVDSLWFRMERLQEALWQQERDRYAPGRVLSRPWFGAGPRIDSVRSALWHSGPEAARLLAERLVGIDLSAVAGVLLLAYQDIALLWGGSAVLGGAAGGLVGAFGAGIGAGPGAVLGVGLGIQVGAWVLGLMGLASLLDDLGHALPEALQHYSSGVQTAWGRRFMQERPDAMQGSREIARGHLVLMTAVLSALAVYLTRGRGDPAARARILDEIRGSRRLGPKVADWVAAHEDELVRHPALKPRQQQVTMAAWRGPPAGAAQAAATATRARPPAAQAGAVLPPLRQAQVPPPGAGEAARVPGGHGQAVARPGRTHQRPHGGPVQGGAG